MILYDIHTHDFSTSQVEEFEIKRIASVFPSEFLEKEKKETEGTFFSSGIHPWFLENADKELEILKEILLKESVVAIGEIGLDSVKGGDVDLQEKIFRDQIELSIKLNMPLIIHCVKAWDQLIQLYKEYTPSSAWIIHGYRGGVIQARQLLTVGFKFSLGEHANNGLMKEISLSSIFFETDISNTSILTIYQKFSSIRGEKLSNVAKFVEENVEKTFKL